MLSPEEISKLHLDNDGEEYRQFVFDDIETNYLVSESGKIFNYVTEYYINPTLDAKGRYVAGLSINGKVYRFYVHQIVYMTYVGPLTPGMTIDHLDENKTNNHWSNLEEVTRSENVIRWNTNNDTKDFLSKEQVEAICKDLQKGIFYKDIAAAMGVAVRSVYEIVTGVTHTGISKLYQPFPDSARYWKGKRRMPKSYIDNLIEQNYSDNDIAQVLGLAMNEDTKRYLFNARKKYNHKYRNYYSDELTAKVENLITSGKSNKEIYEMTGLVYNKPNSWFIARLRQKLQIMDHNPDGIPLEIQEKIKEDIRAGLSNTELEKKYGLDRTPYIVHMEARLRQNLKKELQRLAKESGIHFVESEDMDNLLHLKK